MPLPSDSHMATWLRYPHRRLSDSSSILQALKRANAKINPDDCTLSRIESLPAEIRWIIIGHLSDSQSVKNLLLSGPRFYALVLANERLIACHLVRHHIPARVLVMATGIFKTRQSRMGAVTLIQFCNMAPSRYASVFGKTDDQSSLFEACEYLDQHNAVVYYAKALAAQAMGEASKHVGYRLEVTPTILHRYERCLYMLQFESEMLNQAGRPYRFGPKHFFTRFWTVQAPWDYEQVHCVKELLDTYIKAAIAKQLGGTQDWNRLGDGPKYLRLFTMHHGPRALWALERDSSGTALIRAYIAFSNGPRPYVHTQREDVATNPHLQVLPYLDDLAEQSEKTKGAISSFRADADLGPIKRWYRILLYGNLEANRYEGARHSYFGNIKHLIKSGYALWDDVELGWEPLPPLEVLNDNAVQIYGHMFEQMQPHRRGSFLDTRFGNTRWQDACDLDHIYFQTDPKATIHW
ncbi:hypothetical protein F5Y14DRAFT_451191 [Nemania sp. NC0429]|nr:hypothetical protein F5Y14DRAFT_451191 [Nemania sp. NC0429]